MRISIRFLLLLLPTLALAVFAFLSVFRKIERKNVTNELTKRAQVLADSLHDPIEEALRKGRPEALNRVLKRVLSRQESRPIGIAICDSSGKLLSRSEGSPTWVDCTDAPELARKIPQLVEIKDSLVHRAVFQLAEHDHDEVAGYLVTYHDVSIDLNQRGSLTRNFTVTAFLALGLFISLLTVLVHRWSISRPIAQLSAALKTVVGRNPERLLRSLESTEFAPLVKNLSQILTRVRQDTLVPPMSQNMLWTAASLKTEVTRLFGDSKICVIANREPYIHNRKGTKIDVQFPASGLVSALEPIVRACAGLWIGHGSGTADRETSDKRGLIQVPPGKSEYTLKRIWLTHAEEQGYYYGFSNEGLWPLCHIAHTRPVFRLNDWQQYLTVNSKFAAAFTEEMHDQRPIVLIQDYHFALLPGILRRMRPDAISSLFWHIPWPNAEAIGICPWKTELLSGMLGADLIGFHTQVHCNNFLDTVDRYLEARVDRDTFSVTIRGHTCFVKAFPIGVEWPAKHEYPVDEMPLVKESVFEELNLSQDSVLGLGVDRLDYTKGIVERLLAVERFLELHPEFVGKFSFLQICAPSRTHIKRYQDLNAEVQEVTDRINWRYKKVGYEPIVLRIAHHDAAEVFRYYAAADLCLVSSLHDGMNLVAKEYVAARSDNNGALLLSSFAGAARDMTEAFIINPYDTEECAKAIYLALTMGTEERHMRMARLRELVSSGNVYAWAAQFLNEIHNIASRHHVTQREIV